MITSLGVLFACIAPIILLFALAWLAVAYPAWAHACRFILTPDPQGAGFDSGGVLWPSAVHKQVVALVCGQLVLLAVQAINECFVGVLLLAALVGATLYYAGVLRRRYQPLAADLPLERCMQLDAALWSTARPHADTVPPLDITGRTRCSDRAPAHALSCFGRRPRASGMSEQPACVMCTGAALAAPAARRHREGARRDAPRRRRRWR
jgi:hypothetical protein